MSLLKALGQLRVERRSGQSIRADFALPMGGIARDNRALQLPSLIQTPFSFVRIDSGPGMDCCVLISKGRFAPVAVDAAWWSQRLCPEFTPPEVAAETLCDTE